jgi:hypothetical protein
MNACLVQLNSLLAKMKLIAKFVIMSTTLLKMEPTANVLMDSTNRNKFVRSVGHIVPNVMKKDVSHAMNLSNPMPRRMCL